MRHVEDIKRDIRRSQRKPNTGHQDHIDLINIAEHRERQKCWQTLLEVGSRPLCPP